MKSQLNAIAKVVAAAAVASILAAPAVSFAQSNNGPVTRAEVRAQVVALHNVGYNMNSDNAHYPDNLLAAEGRVNAARGWSSVGSSVSGSSAAGGAAVSKSDWNGMYRGH